MSINDELASRSSYNISLRSFCGTKPQNYVLYEDIHVPRKDTLRDFALLVSFPPAALFGHFFRMYSVDAMYRMTVIFLYKCHEKKLEYSRNPGIEK